MIEGQEEGDRWQADRRRQEGRQEVGRRTVCLTSRQYKWRVWAAGVLDIGRFHLSCILCVA